MVQWNIFKKKKDESVPIEKNVSGKKTLAEHREKLYSSDSPNKKSVAPASSDQRVWRDVSSIEKKVDSVDINKSNSSPDVDKTVDKIIQKRKKQ